MESQKACRKDQRVDSKPSIITTKEPADKLAPATSKDTQKDGKQDSIFVKREGTTDRGKLYEEYMVSWFTLNLIGNENVSDFKIWANDDNFGAFDDILIDINEGQHRWNYALQLKHVEKKKKSLTMNSLLSDKGDLSLKKYFDSFSQLKSEFRNYRFIIWTNSNFKLDGTSTFGNEKVQMKVFKCQSSPLLISEQTCYQFELLKHQGLSEQQFQDYNTFLKSFFLYPNQMHVDRLKLQILHKFSKTFVCGEEVSKRFLSFISEWSIREGQKEKLTEKLLRRIIALVLLNDYIHPFSFPDVITTDNTKLLLEAMSHFDVTLFNEDSLEKVKKVLSSTVRDGVGNLREINWFCKQYQITARNIDRPQDLEDKESSVLLWAMNRYPIIVKDSPATRAAIKLCKDRRYILVGVENTQLEEVSVFKNLSNLKQFEGVFAQIVENFKCSVPIEQTLQQLIREDEEHGNLSTDHMLEMVDSSCKLVQKDEELPEVHIQRSVPKIIIDFSFLKTHQDNKTVVLICNVKEKDRKNEVFRAFTLVTVDKSNESTRIETSPQMQKLYISEHDHSQKMYHDFCEKFKDTSRIHYLRYQSENLEWLASKGDVADLQQHRYSITGKTVATHFSNSLNVLTADPGFGKSVFLRSLRQEYMSRYWTTVMTPKDIRALYKLSPDVRFEDFILEVKCSDLTSFQKLVLRKVLRKGQVVLLWDALDEISDAERRFVEELILTLAQNAKEQWITSRCRLRKILEDKFGVLSKTLSPFDSKQQVEYIEEKFKDRPSTDLEQVTETIMKNIYEASYQDILGVPLQIFMLTELFRQNTQKYVKKFERLVLLTDLYHYFVEEKLDLNFKEKCDYSHDNVAQENIYRQFKRFKIRNYQKSALEIMYGEEFLTEPDTEYYDFLKEICDDGDAGGLIVSVRGDNMQLEFIHNSYAEYFAATYLGEHRTQARNLQNRLFDRKYTNVRFFFDMLAAKRCPAHKAVLCKNLKYLKEHEDSLDSKDLAGRNPLQLLCSWGERYPLLEVQSAGRFATIYRINHQVQYSVTAESSQYMELLEYLLERCDPGEKDSLFGWDSMSYAERCHCLYAMVVIENKTRTSYFNFKDDKFICNLLYHAVCFGYDHVINLFENINYIENMSRNSLLDIAVAYNRANWLTKLLSQANYKRRINMKDRENGYTPLHIATYKGHIEAIRQLIQSGASPNITDKVGTTPLHLALIMGQISLFKALTRKGDTVSPVNPTKDDITALRFVCSTGLAPMLEALLQDGINFTAVKGLLDRACLGHLPVVEILLQKGANVNEASYDGTTPLSVACHYGDILIVQLLLQQGARVTSMSRVGTPLHVACQNGHVPIAEILLQNGATVDGVNRDGWTPLHWACRNGHVSLVRFLLEKGANVNASSKKWLTPLHLAYWGKRGSVVEVLLRNGAIVNWYSFFLPYCLVAFCMAARVFRYVSIFLSLSWYLLEWYYDS